MKKWGARPIEESRDRVLPENQKDNTGNKSTGWFPLLPSPFFGILTAFL